jgi:hypothetical protein
MPNRRRGRSLRCNGLAVFERLRRKREGRHVFFYAFDLLELDGTNLRREPIETRSARPKRIGTNEGRAIHEPSFSLRHSGVTRRLSEPQPDSGATELDSCQMSLEKPGARLEISIDGVPRSYRDQRDMAIEAAAQLMLIIRTAPSR